MLLSGLHLSSFRSIGSQGFALSPLSRVNVIVGPNNSGKSNALAFTKRIITAIKTNRPLEFGDLDYHRRDKASKPSARLYFALAETSLGTSLGLDELFLDFTFPVDDPPVIRSSTYEHLDDVSELVRLLRRLRGDTPVGRSPSEYHELSRKLIQDVFVQQLQKTLPEVTLVPEFRQIRNGELTADGSGLFRRLQQLQSPIVGADEDKKHFARFKEAIRELLKIPDAEVEIPHDASTVNITTHDLMLPLSSFGTGIHQLVIILANAITTSDSLVLIEEPEIHLHPQSLRDLIGILQKYSNNRFILTSHSHTLINSLPDVNVFATSIDQNVTTGGRAVDDRESLEIMARLGVKPSDLLQANAVLWVEGPSDRNYIKRWIRLLAPDLREGKEFSVMFYGGKLLSHICFDRNVDADELIKMLRINQHAVVVMDSDRQGPTFGIRPTKARIKTECNENGSLPWITWGREIENYLPGSVITAGLDKLNRPGTSISLGKFDRIETVISTELRRIRARALDYGNDKPGFSKLFAEGFEEKDFSRELRREVQAVVSAIRKWN